MAAYSLRGIAADSQPTRPTSGPFKVRCGLLLCVAVSSYAPAQADIRNANVLYDKPNCEKKAADRSIVFNRMYVQ